MKGNALTQRAEFSVVIVRPGYKDRVILCPPGSAVIITGGHREPLRDFDDRVAWPEGFREITWGTIYPFSIHFLLKKTRRGSQRPRKVVPMVYIGKMSE